MLYWCQSRSATDRTENPTMTRNTLDGPYTILTSNERDSAKVAAHVEAKQDRITAYDTWMRRGWDTDQQAYEQALNAERNAWYVAFTRTTT
jgi:hypothetical protein